MGLEAVFTPLWGYLFYFGKRVPNSPGLLQSSDIAKDDLNSHQSPCLCLPRARTTDVHHQPTSMCCQRWSAVFFCPRGRLLGLLRLFVSFAPLGTTAVVCLRGTGSFTGFGDEIHSSRVIACSPLQALNEHLLCAWTNKICEAPVLTKPGVPVQGSAFPPSSHDSLWARTKASLYRAGWC